MIKRSPSSVKVFPTGSSVPKSFNDKLFPITADLKVLFFRKVPDFKVKPINNTNSVEKATKTNDFAHALAYTARPSEYLNGHGMGSSYLLETYADYGYIGIIVYSILLGYFMSSITYILNRRNLFSIITLYSIKEIYVIPRSSALGFLSFLGRIGFWMPIIAIIFIIEIIRILKGRQVVNSTKRIAFINNDFSVLGGVEKVTEGFEYYFRVLNKFSKCKS